MRVLQFDGAAVKPGYRGRALTEDAARLLERLRNRPLPDDPRTAAALRRATEAAFAILEQARKLAERQAREPKETP